MAVRSFPGLISIIDELLAFSTEVVEQGVTTGDHFNNPSDRAATMIATYFYRQIEHLNSVRMLAVGGQHRDAGLIARTMLEGAVQLAWAMMKRPEGPEEWYWYCLIEEWRMLNKQKVPIPNEFERLLAIHGPEYYSRKALERLSGGKPLPQDPYRREWQKLDIASMFDQIDTKPVYESYYRLTSSWTHWNPNQILGNLVAKAGRERYEVDDPQSAVVALAAAVASFIDVLAVAIGYFEIPDPAFDRFSELAGRFDTLTKSVRINPEKGSNIQRSRHGTLSHVARDHIAAIGSAGVDAALEAAPDHQVAEERRSSCDPGVAV
jgi:hypothetical protein